jgi:integrase
MTEFKSSKTALQYNNDPLQNFLYALKAPDSKRQYPRRFEYFLDYLGLKGTLKEKCIIFYEQAKHDPLWTQHQIMQYVEFQKERAEKGEIAESTINNYYKSVKLFCEMNDIILNWKKIAKGKPQHRDYANDRAPTIEEIKKLLDFPDRRIKVIVLFMLSSGIRVGAWDYLKWKHVIPIKNDENNEVIAAKIIVYASTREEYFSFITPEAFAVLQEYIEFRSSCGEKISGESWLIRDIWKSTNVKFQNRGGLATVPRKLKSSGIRSIISRAEWEQGIREPLPDGKKRHEFQAVHSLRKFFKSHCEQVMKSINVEILMGHNIGVSNSYYKPSQKEILDDYLKAINALTINKNNNNNVIIEKEIKELKEKNENNEYIIHSKLQERDDAIMSLSDQVMQLMEEVKKLKEDK